MPDAKLKLVTCPQCGKRAVFGPENLFRPFCSERCKMIDLGHWAAEDYRIPAPAEPNGSLDDNPN